MIASDVITRVRVVLADDTQTYRWSNVKLLYWLNDGERAIIKMRPDSLFDEDEQLTFAETGDIDGAVTLGDNWREQLVNYIVARAYESDAGDRRDTDLSNLFWQKFNAGVQQ